MVPRLWNVRRRRQETSDTFTLVIEPPEEASDYRFAPGQFNMLWVHGVGEVPISISSDPTRPHLVEHTTRVVGAVTRAMSSFRRGDQIGVRGPFGTPWPIEESAGRDVVVIAGGIGLAPLRPAILRLLATRDRFRRFSVLFGARTPGDILFLKDLQAWSASFNIEVLVTVDRAEQGWHGNVGVVPALVRRAPFSGPETVAMICGPELMIRATVGELEHRGVERRNIHVSLERNMKCGVGLCGHCQLGSHFICRDGPVFPHSRVSKVLAEREL